MTVLSTLQNYAETLLENCQGPWLEFALNHKWSIVAGAAAFYATYTYITRPKNLPPGPQGLPVLGILLQLSMNLHRDSINYSKKYNSDVVSYYIGRQLHVMLNSADAIKLAFVKTSDFAHMDTAMKAEFDSHEQIFTETYSEDWKKFKSFCIGSLKTHGFGTVKSEENIKLQLRRIAEHLENLPDQTIDSDELKILLSKAGGSIIMKIIANQNYEFDDPELEDLITRVKNFMNVFYENVFTLLFLNNIFPSFILYFIKWRYVKKCRSTLAAMRAFILEQYEDHRATLDVNHSRDFIDDMLLNNKKAFDLTDYQIADTIVLFAPDAVDTVSNLMQWVLFYICWHQDVQEKMLEEIQSVCGDKPPGLMDRSRTVYCEAVLLECLRAGSIAVFTSSHINLEDTELKGYHIPKRTSVMANLYAVHYDEKLFPEPKAFKPTRYLSADGKLVNYENVMPFSTGLRKCVGAPLTKSLVYLYTTGLVQKYKLTFPEGQKPDSPECDSLIRLPPKHKIKFTSRY